MSAAAPQLTRIEQNQYELYNDVQFCEANLLGTKAVTKLTEKSKRK